MSFKSLHAVPYFIPLGSHLLDVTTLGTYRVAPYFIPLGSPLPDVTTMGNYRIAPYFIPLGSPLLWRGWGRIVRLLTSGSLVFARVVSGGAVGFAGQGAGH